MAIHPHPISNRRDDAWRPRMSFLEHAVGREDSVKRSLAVWEAGSWIQLLVEAALLASALLLGACASAGTWESLTRGNRAAVPGDLLDAAASYMSAIVGGRWDSAYGFLCLNGDLGLEADYPVDRFRDYMGALGIVRFELQGVSYDAGAPQSPAIPPSAVLRGCAAVRLHSGRIQLFFVAEQINGRWRFGEPQPPGLGPVPTCSFQKGSRVWH